MKFVAIMTEKMIMRAASYHSQGSARDVLRIEEVPLPEPGPGQVRVRIAMSGLNHSDIKSRTGFLGPMHFERIVPHQDGSGVIDRIGSGVSTGRLHQRVWIYKGQYGRADGTAAEYIVIPSDHAVVLPDNISFAVGASLGVPALTAHHSLFADGSLKGRRVLIHGAAGVVGEAAILLAKWAGAWVAVTIREAEDEDNALSKGADLVINMTREDVAQEILRATDGIGVDRIVEVDLVSNMDTDRISLAPGGVISTYSAATPDQAIAVPILKAMRGNIALRFVYVYTIPETAKRKAIEDITQCLAEGQYNPTIGLSLPLDRIVEAHEALEDRSVKGKILIEINNSEGLAR